MATTAKNNKNKDSRPTSGGKSGTEGKGSSTGKQQRSGEDKMETEHDTK
jgi:hypothetical protein